MRGAEGVLDEPFEVTLRDGTRALIRLLVPADRERLEQGFARLSPASRYLRFHSQIKVLSDAQLRYFTEIDYRDHVAWGALEADAPDQPGMGVARYVRLESQPDVAEGAITVLDEYQGRGVGTVLLGVLIRSARANGIATLRNYVLVDNASMLHLFADLGATRAYDGDGVYRVDVPLPDDLADLPHTAAAEIVRAVAARRLPPLTAVQPPVWAAPDQG